MICPPGKWHLPQFSLFPPQFHRFPPLVHKKSTAFSNPKFSAPSCFSQKSLIHYLIEKEEPAGNPTGSLFQKAATPHPGTDAARNCFPGASDPLAPSYAEPAGAVTGLSFGGSRSLLPNPKEKRVF
jgi:hypothetical protein